MARKLDEQSQRLLTENNTTKMGQNIGYQKNWIE